MLTADGGVKLLDFGVAKLGDSTITQSGATPGTVAYMAPEQIRGENADARSDLWSLGVVLHEVLTGARPFLGSHDAAVMQAILHGDPPPLGEQRLLSQLAPRRSAIPYWDAVCSPAAARRAVSA